jgi:molybdopterin synthase sulfur carrier subunit
MKLQLKFFASLREALGVSQESVEIPDGIQTIAELRIYLAKRSDTWAQALAEGRALRCALNQEMVEASTALQDDAEIAFFPPVTGG